MKTKSGAKKRFRLTASGKVRCGQAGKRHGMVKRSQSMIRKARGTTIMRDCDAKAVLRHMLPNAKKEEKKRMARVKRGVTKHARHAKVIKAAKGYRGRSKNCYNTAKDSVEKGWQYAYRDRKVRKRQFRALWIQRINAAARLHGLTYSQFMGGVIKANIDVDRKILAELAANDIGAFKGIVEKAKAHLN